MSLGIQSRVVRLSLSNTVELLEDLGVQRSQKTVHNWVQKADVQPDSGNHRIRFRLTKQHPDKNSRTNCGGVVRPNLRLEFRRYVKENTKYNRISYSFRCDRSLRRHGIRRRRTSHPDVCTQQTPKSGCSRVPSHLVLYGSPSQCPAARV